MALNACFPAVATKETFFVTQQAANILRHLPILGRRMLQQGHLYLVDSQNLGSMVRQLLSVESAELGRSRLYASVSTFFEF